MTIISLVLVFIALFAFVAGQLLLKKAMDAANLSGFKSPKFFWPLATGVFLLGAQFFLNLGLLQRFDLSFIYPFQGLSVIIIAVAAAVVLREKLSIQLVAGSVLISAGIVLVSLTS
ncbi:MAG TPA: EamA family transporter [Chthoniobacterales bacterium]|nr:EamA family transporter [Chthoniobacterales bacterium]